MAVKSSLALPQSDKILTPGVPTIVEINNTGQKDLK
jgi:hypothetical protein